MRGKVERNNRQISDANVARAIYLITRLNELPFGGFDEFGDNVLSSLGQQRLPYLPEAWSKPLRCLQIQTKEHVMSCHYCTELDSRQVVAPAVLMNSTANITEHHNGSVD